MLTSWVPDLKLYNVQDKLIDRSGASNVEVMNILLKIAGKNSNVHSVLISKKIFNHVSARKRCSIYVQEKKTVEKCT